jgi:hypothetical protein
MKLGIFSRILDLSFSHFKAKSLAISAVTNCLSPVSLALPVSLIPKTVGLPLLIIKSG